MLMGNTMGPGERRGYKRTVLSTAPDPSLDDNSHGKSPLALQAFTTIASIGHVVQPTIQIFMGYIS